jgi:CheY-like chemotaxis protein
MSDNPQCKEPPCKSILIVEDDQSIRETIALALEYEGYRVATAANGREALDMLPRMPKPCLILLDLMMPVMNGWEFADALNKDVVLATIPIVVVTAYEDQAGSIRSKALIKKPVDLNVLYKTVRDCCEVASDKRAA